jgi:hypothetical protein
MSTIYVKRGSVIAADAFDPTRTDQGAAIMQTDDDPPEYISATVVSRGRVTSVRPGDMLCTTDTGLLVLPPANFALIYQPLDDVVQNDAIVQTGGNQ